MATTYKGSQNAQQVASFLIQTSAMVVRIIIIAVKDVYWTVIFPIVEQYLRLDAALEEF